MHRLEIQLEDSEIALHKFYEQFQDQHEDESVFGKEVFFLFYSILLVYASVIVLCT